MCKQVQLEMTLKFPLLLKDLKKKISKHSPELLSKAVDTIPLLEDNILLNLLVKVMANTPLNAIEFNRLSITALKHLLSCTYEKEILFMPARLIAYQVIKGEKC